MLNIFTKKVNEERSGNLQGLQSKKMARNVLDSRRVSLATTQEDVRSPIEPREFPELLLPLERPKHSQIKIK